MRLEEFKIKNFRSYKEQVSIKLDSFVAFVGRNDVGKSTVLDAMEIFFNESSKIVKLDNEDVNKELLKTGDKEIVFTAVFSNLPDEIIIDSQNSTNLKDEYLLNEDGHLEITKKYPNGGKGKTFITAEHPTHKKCSDLLLKTQSQLKKIVEEESIECENKSKNAVMRRSIWNHYYDDLDIQTQEIEVTKEGAKSIWDNLSKYLPVYSLFQSDRKNTDSDVEVQNPLTEAVKQILAQNEIQEKLNEVAKTVHKEISEVSQTTLEKLKEMNPELANELKPSIAETAKLKWADVFKNIGITSDNDIPINKRGSGVKRLVLLNFFRAQAEQRQAKEGSPNVIYAIEEPETSQHAYHIKILIDALIELSELENTQVLITTHSSLLLKKLSFENIRLIKEENNNRTIEDVDPSALPYPSLNEINFNIFKDISSEYHNELYGHLEATDLLDIFETTQPTKLYKRHNRNGEIKEENPSFSRYIRHQIHHPENDLNERFNESELEKSIIEMRQFIINQRNLDSSF